MKDKEDADRGAGSGKPGWLKYALIVLIVEKIIQHIVVTMALYFNWKDIASTVAVNPSLLMVLGAIVALLFVLGLWGMVTRKKWAVNLVIGLALFDFVGEFVAQGTLYIIITVSILVATILLILGLDTGGNRRGRGSGAPAALWSASGPESTAGSARRWRGCGCGW